MNTCKRRGSQLPEQWLYHLPRDLAGLCAALGLPAKTVTTLIANGSIPTRRAVDKNGRSYGPILVLFADAAAAMRGSQSDTQ